jgi:hemerythrin superfamily protein
VDILDLLKQDHQKVSAMIAQVEKTDAEDRRLVELAQQIAQELTIHSALEEAMFYPVLRDRAEEDEQRIDVFEAFTEHDVVKHLLGLIGGRRKDPEVFKAELQVLGENVKHHVREEESTIFDLAHELLDDDERAALGEQVQMEKERLMRGGRAGGRKKTAARATGRKKSTRTTSARGKKTSARGKKSSTRGGGRKKKTRR